MMAIEVSCPGCLKAYRLKEELAGKTVRCPACQEVMKVPAPSNGEAWDDLTPQAMKKMGERLVGNRGTTPIFPAVVRQQSMDLSSRRLQTRLQEWSLRTVQPAMKLFRSNNLFGPTLRRKFQTTTIGTKTWEPRGRTCLSHVLVCTC